MTEPSAARAPETLLGLAYRPDGSLLAGARLDGTLDVWPARGTSPVRGVKAHEQWATAVAFHPRGHMLASCSYDCTVKLWDLATGRSIRVLEGHDVGVTGVAFSSGGGQLASSGWDGTVRLWDVDDGHELRSMRGPGKGFLDVTFSPSGLLLATAGQDGMVRVWIAETGEPYAGYPAHQGVVYRIAYAPDGRHIVSAGADGMVRVWDTAAKGETLTLAGHARTVFAVAFHPSEPWLASAGADGTVRVWDLSTAQTIRVFTGRGGIVHALAFHPDGRSLASGGRDGLVNHWQLAADEVAARTNDTPRPRRERTARAEPVLAAAAPLTMDETIVKPAGWQTGLRIRLAPEPALPVLPDDSANETLPPPALPTIRIPRETDPTLVGYDMLEVLGRGGMGVVYKARQRGLNRLVALKMILSGSHASPADRARFRAEAEAVARLEHANIVRIYEVGEQAGRPFFSLELIEGGSLQQKLVDQLLPLRDAALLMRRLAEAVHYAHSRGVVHRDLKPANILLTPAGQPKITDFGLAKCLEGDAQHTTTGAVVGTPAYMAPEQAEGRNADVGPAADIYSLGAICYDLLTGRPPFRGETAMQTLRIALTEEPVPPLQLRAKLPLDLQTICLKCLEKDPAKRYATAQHLADDLRRYLDGEPILARAISRPERAWRWCRRNPLVAGILLALTLGPAIGLWHLSVLSASLVRSTALESAAQQSDMLEGINSFYSSRVVDRVRAHGIEVAHDYADPKKKGAIPLPATLTIELGQFITSQSETGIQVRLYSDLPFKSRKDGGPRDDFEQDALDRLRADPKTPVYRFEEFQGKPTLRYATARVMRETCVKCHNTHPESPRTDWTVGEMRGVVEIIRPLERDEAKTRQGLQGTFLLVGGVAFGLLGLSSVGLLASHWQRRRQPANEPAAS